MSRIWLRTYTLLGKVPVPCLNTLAWGRWLEQNFANRSVAIDRLDVAVDGTQHEIRVSTVFLGLDHDHSGQGPPLLFESMVFGGPHAGDMERYTTWDEAESGHRRLLARERAWIDAGTAGDEGGGNTEDDLRAAGAGAEAPQAQGHSAEPDE